MNCEAAYEVDGDSDNGTFRACPNTAETTRFAQPEPGWVVIVHLCYPHAELWDSAVPHSSIV